MPDVIGEEMLTNNTVSELSKHVAKLSLGTLEILVPQSEVVSIENNYTLERGDDNRFMGEINKQKEKLPVYCLSETMEVLDKLPDERFQCVVMHGAKSDFALLCHDINKFELNAIHHAPVPLCMDNGVTPITDFCTYKDAENVTKLGMLTNVTSLKKYLNRLN